MNKIPYVDLRTGKINNCEKGSWAWYHEKGHLAYHKTELSGRLEVWQNIFFWFWMIGVTLSTFNKYMFAISLPMLLIYIGIEIFEEHWCNRFASKEIERFKKKQNSII